MRRSSLAACAVFILSLGTAALYAGSQRIDGDGSLFRWTEARTDLAMLTNALELSARQRGRLPSESEGLTSLVTGDPRYFDKLPNDPWRRPYVYRRVAVEPGFEVYSLGQNGKDEFGKGDDIVSWDKSYRCEDYSVGCVVTARQLPFAALALLMLISLAVLGYRSTKASVRNLLARFR